MRTRNQVFISYAHEDAEWRDAFRLMLDPAVKRGSISLWSDEQIPIGADWAMEIARALETASVGLLLVTPHFLGSRFINEVELKRLVSLAQTAGVSICWVPVSPSLFQHTELRMIQAAWNPESPLDQLPLQAQQAAIQKICLQVVEDFGFLPNVSNRRRLVLPELVQKRLGDRYEIDPKEVGAGKLSIVYRAQQKNPSRTVAVKVFVASEFDDPASAAIATAIQRGAELTSAAFIKIIEHSMELQPEFLVTEFVEGEPLSRYLWKYPNGVPLGTVRGILLGLTQALEEMHKRGWPRGELCASDVLIEPGGAARLSAADYSSLVGDDSPMAVNFLVDRETLDYMTPERYEGRPHTELTDQYSLGLLAVELLGGERLPSVLAPVDLELKRDQFAKLEAGNGRWSKRSPGFAGFVSRLLRHNPAERWPSMREARHILRDIHVADPLRDAAKAWYVQLQVGDTAMKFFKSFYQNLFERCPDVGPRFAGDMDSQSKILNGAILRLLDFEPANGNEPLRGLAARHRAFELSRRHYDHFLEALLETIRQSGGDDSLLAAWRTTVSPAIDFMCDSQGLAAEP